jgi:hypothetical protein
MQLNKLPAPNNQRFVVAENQAMKLLLNGTVSMAISNVDFVF